MVTNWYEVEHRPGTSWYQYGLDFMGVNNRQQRKAVWIAASKQLIADENKRKKFIFDGNTIYSPDGDFPLDIDGEVTVLLGDQEYTLRMVSKTSLDLNTPHPKVMQTLNLILKRALKEGKHLRLIGRDFYDLKPMELNNPRMEEKVDILTGYTTEIAWKDFEGSTPKLMFNVDTITKVLSKVTVLDDIYHIAGNRNFADPAVQKAITRRFIDTVVATSYNYQTYTIEDIDFTKTPASIFIWDNHRTKTQTKISFRDYLLKIHNYKVTDQYQPMIKTSGRQRQTIYLVPEFCYQTDIPENAKRELPKICSVFPTERIKKYDTLISLLSMAQSPSAEPAKLLQTFNMRIKKNLTTVRAIQLKPPELFIPGVGPITAGNDFGRYMKDNPKFKWTEKPVNWKLYATYEDKSVDIAKDWVNNFISTLKTHNCPVVFAETIPVRVANGGSHVEALKSKLAKSTGMEFVICFLSASGARGTEQYQSIKNFTLQTGVLTQCIDIDPNSKSFEKKTGKDAKNIQFNISRQLINKTGELCWWSIISNAVPSLKGKTVLVIGIDVYHGKKIFDKGAERYRQKRSIGAFVAALIQPTNQGKFKTSCGINLHEARAELIGGPQKERHGMQEAQMPTDLAPDEELERPHATENEALAKFITRINSEHKLPKGPDVIIVFRDGVAHSQLAAAKKWEVSQVKKAAPNAAVIYSILQKRIHTRFVIRKDDGTSGSPPPGTVISKDLQLSGEPYSNFYLIPTSCTLSTVKPVHYIVIHNDNIPLNEFQQLTYNFCHLYPNWTNSIKLPFVTQAAHKMAYLLGDLKLENPTLHQNLYTSYFYL
uniref:Piwi domain-containing protein n=1 Tax=Arcella intermedia TaxID=1963864 RepID=A0A6B2KXT7_9EUKA